MRAIILAGGPDVDERQLRETVRADDLVVVADGGLAHAVSLGLRPGAVLGDFDSATAGDVAAAERLGWSLTRVPREKDETDTELAVNWALSRGATEILLFGATGGRLDHTLANAMLLASLATAGIPATMVDCRHEVRAMAGGSLELPAAAGAYLSLIPLSAEVTGVTVSGAKYPLTNATLKFGKSLPVSNEFTGRPVQISAEAGLMLIITAREIHSRPNAKGSAVR